ncbi:hypothetical protein [Caulobacter sp. 17J80-11]|uniref:hypothetical protein n=1 Tax=Caulobacter sp. 17J80-11 TaxID=2763502 RepID=UPI001653BE73|nr:hypothetical protein [Caulobacter sp. 17J80-11]MBC6983534.1 hypothetical protein [Caulobacter sp. 17J80-11]
MKMGLFGFNMLALAALVGPALLIFMSADQTQTVAPTTRTVFFSLLGGGSLACLGAMALLSRKRAADPFLTVTLLLFGLLGLAGAIGALFAVTAVR